MCRLPFHPPGSRPRFSLGCPRAPESCRFLGGLGLNWALCTQPNGVGLKNHGNATQIQRAPCFFHPPKLFLFTLPFFSTLKPCLGTVCGNLVSPTLRNPFSSTPHLVFFTLCLVFFHPPPCFFHPPPCFFHPRACLVHPATLFCSP